MADLVIKESWIVRQLECIQQLEKELSAAFKNPVGRSDEELRRRLHRLNLWVSTVDVALSGRVPKSRPRSRETRAIGMRPSATPFIA